jgi:hypothetical protein
MLFDPAHMGKNVKFKQPVIYTLWMQLKSDTIVVMTDSL